MNSNTIEIKKIIYWDPTRGLKNLKDKNATYDEHNSLYTLHWGLEIQLNQQMIDDWKAAADLKNLKLKLTSNSYFIFAGNYYLYDAWEEHIQGFSLSIVPNATHRFEEVKTLERLYLETLKFLAE